jgi:hypothetical protein
LKEKFSAIEEESHFNDLSRDTSKTESQLNFFKMSKNKNSSRTSFNRESLQLGQKSLNGAFVIDKNNQHRNSIRVSVPTSPATEYNGFAKKNKQQYEEVSGNNYFSNEPDKKKDKRPNFNIVSKSLTGIYQPRNLSKTSQLLYKNQQKLSPQSDMIAQNENKIKNSFHLENEEADYGKEFNRSNTFGFNKYIHSSSKISPNENDEKMQMFELETGRMSQKTSSGIYSQNEIAKGSQYSISNSLVRKGKEEMEIILR